MSVRTSLREATAADHARVDALFSTLRMDDAADYVRFLRAQAAAHLPVEAALDRAGVAAVVPDWAGRRRGAALIADLADLGEPVPEPVAVPALATPAEILGATYVLEGSRLGGAVLRRGVAPDMPARFLTPGASSLWRKLMEMLDEQVTTTEAVAQAIAAARMVFAAFERSGRNHLEASALGRRG